MAIKAELRSVLYRVVGGSSFSWLPVLLLATGLNTSLVFGSLAAAAAQGEGTAVPPDRLVLLFWSALAIYLLIGYETTRCTRLELTLPLSARRLWLGHVAAVLAAGLAMMALSLGSAGLMARAAVQLHPALESSLALRQFVPLLTAGLLLAIALFESDDPPRQRIRGGIGGLSRRFIVVLAVGAGVWALSTLSALWSLPVAGVAVGLLAATYRSLPEAFLLLPERPMRETPNGHGADVVDSSDAATTRPGRLRTALLARILYNIPPWGPVTAWVELVAVALMGALVGGFFELFLDSDADGMSYMQLPLCVYMLLAVFAPLTTQMGSLDPLPISRRRIFAVVIVPSLLAMVAGYAAVRLTRSARPAPPLVDYRIDGPFYWVDVPEALMGISVDGPPMLDSPWGETHEAWHRPLAAGGRIVLYSPFNTLEESSARFEALMASRAIDTAHDLHLPWQEVLERYFEVADDRVVGLKHGRLTLLEDFPGLEGLSPGPLSALVLTLVIAPFFLLLALFLRSFRATRSDRRRQTLFWSFAGALIVIMIGGFALEVTGWFNQRVAWRALEIGALRLGQSATATILTWGLCGLAIAAAYRLAERTFQRIELPTSATRFTLIDFTRQ